MCMVKLYLRLLLLADTNLALCYINFSIFWWFVKMPGLRATPIKGLVLANFSCLRVDHYRWESKWPLRIVKHPIVTYYHTVCKMNSLNSIVAGILQISSECSPQKLLFLTKGLPLAAWLDQGKKLIGWILKLARKMSRDWQLLWALTIDAWIPSWYPVIGSWNKQSKFIQSCRMFKFLHVTFHWQILRFQCPCLQTKKKPLNSGQTAIPLQWTPSKSGPLKCSHPCIFRPLPVYALL